MTASSSTSTATRQQQQPPPQPQPQPPASRDTLQLIVCALGIYACYLRYGLLQEKIYKTPHGPDAEHYAFSLFLVAMQTATNAAVALLVLILAPLFTGKRGAADAGSDATQQQQPAPAARGVVCGVPLLDYMIVALSYLSAMVFSFTALNHMSYPMQALGKSCKMIPVMLMGILIRGRRYTAREFACVALITAGVALFSFKGGKSDGDRPASMLGFALLFASLFMDGVTGPLQERVVARFRPSTHQLMFWQNLCSVVWLVVALVVTGEGRDAIVFLSRFPAALTDMLAFSIVSALGQNFIFYTVRNFSALVVTTITTTRKMFTVLLSIFVYNHAMKPRQWAGLVLVFAAISWEAAAKQRAKAAKAAKAAKDGEAVESKKDQ